LKQVRKEATGHETVDSDEARQRDSRNGHDR
jgi:hypothetical protein